MIPHTRLFLSAALALTATSSAFAASEYISYNPGSPYSAANKGAPGDPNVYFAVPGQQTPAPQSLGSRVGNYWVESSWNADLLNGTDVTYNVDGTLSTPVNQKNYPQGSLGDLNGVWSGFKQLGNASLTGSSQLNVTSATTVNFTAVSRVSKLDGTLISPIGLTYAGSQGQAPGVLSSPGVSTYTFASGGTEAFYNLSSLTTAGLYNIQISWGIDAGSGADQLSTWTYNPGNGGALLTAAIDNNKFSEGTAAQPQLNGGNNNRQWSGFYDLGTSFYDPSLSQLSFTTPGGAARTGAVVQFTAVPEPSTYALMGLGALGLFFVRRRRMARAR